MNRLKEEEEELPVTLSVPSQSQSSPIIHFANVENVDDFGTPISSHLSLRRRFAELELLLNL